MRVRREVLEAIVAHARRENPRECCGLLVGDSHQAIEAVPVTNVAEEPLRQYEVSPVEHLAQIKRCRERSSSAGDALDVIGAYHSHPRSHARPSPTDLERACQDFLFVIAGPVSEAADVPVRGYRLNAGVFEEVQLVVVD
jgi:proteasome lid subunit RPN8/RPN11